MRPLFTILVTIGLTCAAAVASAQTPQRPSDRGAVSGKTIEGVVVSATRSTLVLRTGVDSFELVKLDTLTTRPAVLPIGASVAVTAVPPPAGETTPVATRVRVTALPKEVPKTEEAAAPAPDEPVPQSVRKLEQQIKHQTSRYHFGARTGMGLDPEIVTIGGQAQLGPFFSDNLWFRPSLDFGFGELTTAIAMNFEAMFRLPTTAPEGKWASYAGVGPALNFSHKAFETPSGDTTDHFSFSDLSFDGGVTFFLGIQSRSGPFMELRATAYSTPHLHFLVGYNF